MHTCTFVYTDQNVPWNSVLKGGRTPWISLILMCIEKLSGTRQWNFTNMPFFHFIHLMETEIELSLRKLLGGFTPSLKKAKDRIGESEDLSVGQFYESMSNCKQWLTKDKWNAWTIYTGKHVNKTKMISPGEFSKGDCSMTRSRQTNRQTNDTPLVMLL